MGVVKNIFLPIDAEGPFEHIKTMQGNKDSLTVEITLLSGGMPISLAAGVTPRLQYQKPDGHIVEKECPVVNQKVVVEYTEQMLIAAGTAKGQIYYEEGTEGIYSSAWYTDIYPTVSGELEESSSEYNTINALINKAVAQATAASTSAKNANTSASSASASATKAFGYVEQCEAILEEMGYGTEIVGNGHGKVVTVDDANGAELIELTIYGKSVQNSYSGKNKLDNTNVYNRTDTTGTPTDTGVSVTGAWFAFYKVKVLANTDYNISYIKSGEGVNRCNILQSDVSTIIKSFVDNSGGTFNTGNNTEICIAFYSGTGTSGTSIYTDIQLELGTVATPFEKYVGGEPSPSPSYPQDITSVADDKSLVVKSVGKNLLKLNTTPQTVYGVAYTVNNGIVTANGTATSTADFTPILHSNQILIPKGEYILSGCPSGGAENKYLLLLSHYENGNYSRIVADYGNGATVSFEEDTLVYIITRVYNGQTVNNLTFKPMLRLASIEDDTYEPYISTQASLTLTDSLRGIPVAEGGNYTDENGQSWICDTIEKCADGTGMWTKRVGVVVADGINVKTTYKSGTASDMYMIHIGNSVPAVVDNVKGNLMCSHFVANTFNNLWYGAEGISLFRENGGQFRISFSLDRGINTIDLCNEWLQENNITIYYEMVEPIETDLTAEQMAELEKLMSFEGYTTVSTDDMGEVAIQCFKGNDSGKIVSTVLELTKLNRENIDQLKTDSEQLEDNIQQFGETLSELESKDNITEIEKLIGRLGGKPLYRKLIKVDSITADTSVNIDSAKCVYNAYGRCKFSGSAEYMQIPNFIVYVSELNGMVTLTNRIGSATGGNVAVENIEIVIEYTKAEAVG